MCQERRRGKRAQLMYILSFLAQYLLQPMQPFRVLANTKLGYTKQMGKQV